MPMGTTDERHPPQTMAPAPAATQQARTPPFPGSDETGARKVYAPGEMIPPPGWAGTQNVDEPFLPRDFDKVLVMRCYPEAESFGELREIAYQHGREVLEMARESTRQQAELAGQPDPHDPTQQPQQPPQPGQPQPGQQPPNPTPAPTPSREAREGQRQEQQRHEHDEQARRQHERDDDKKK